MAAATTTVAVLAAAAAILQPHDAAQVAAGLEAHSLCAAVFVQGVDPDETHREMIGLLAGPAARLLHHRIDRTAQTVDADLAGLTHAHARFIPGYGCRLDHPGDAPPPAPLPPSAPPADDGFAPAGVVAATDPAVAAAIDRVFAERPDTTIKQVKAVVVVKDGHVVAERYAAGYGPQTPLLSYSVAKSFTNALLAVLVREGKLRMDQPLRPAEWSKPGDPRAPITPEDLLRMRSGLDAPEDDSATSAVARMEFIASDMAGYVAKAPLKAPIGSAYEYTSANTLILDRRIGELVGGGPAGLRAFAGRELFGPLHMSNVTMEFDGAGTFVGSTWVYAPARDFARFGLLYLNDGIAPDGRRLLPEGWVAWSRRSTLGAPYGAGFWTVDGGSGMARHLIAEGVPADAFFASGNLGQRIYVVPSQKLVVARFGYSKGPTYGIDDDAALIKAASSKP
jgi:hypothetical protein